VSVAVQMLRHCCFSNLQSPCTVKLGTVQIQNTVHNKGTSNDQFTKNHKANHSQHNLHGGYRLYMTIGLTRQRLIYIPVT